MIVNHLLSVCLVHCKRATGFSGLKGATCDRSSCIHCPPGTETLLAKDYCKGRKSQQLATTDTRVSPSVSPYPLPGCHAMYKSENTKNFFKTQTYSGCGCLNSHKGLYCTPRVWEALVQSCCFGLVRGRVLRN